MSVDWLSSKRASFSSSGGIDQTSLRLLVNHFCATFGYQVTHNSLRLFLLSAHGSSSEAVGVLASVSVVSELPCLFFAMFAGSWADAARDGRLLLLGPGLLSSVASISLCLVYYSLGTLLPWHIYAAVFLMSTCAVIRDPMVDRLLGARLHAASLARWTAWFQFSLGACDTLSPLVASLIVASGGLRGIALFDTSASLTAVAALAFGADLVVPAAPPLNLARALAAAADDEVVVLSSDDSSVFTSQLTRRDADDGEDAAERGGGSGDGDDGDSVTMSEFFRWLVRQRLLLVLMGVFMWCNGVYAQVMVLLPVLLKEHYSVIAVGTVLSGSSLGVLLGAFVLGASPYLTQLCTYNPLGSVLFFVALQGLMLLGLLLRPHALLCAIGGCLYHACEPPIAAAAAVIVNGATPNQMQGRFSSAKLFLVTLGMPLANLVLSPLVDYMGTMPLIAFLGSSLIVLPVLVYAAGESKKAAAAQHFKQ